MNGKSSKSNFFLNELPMNLNRDKLADVREISFMLPAPFVYSTSIITEEAVEGSFSDDNKIKFKRNSDTNFTDLPEIYEITDYPEINTEIAVPRSSSILKNNINDNGNSSNENSEKVEPKLKNEDTISTIEPIRIIKSQTENDSERNGSFDFEFYQKNHITTRYKLYSVVYGMIIIVLGVLLPIVETAMIGVVIETQLADNIFELVLFIISILWFIYCFIDMSVFKRQPRIDKNGHTVFPKYTHSTEMASGGLYIKTGCGIFCMATLLYNGLNLAQAFEYKNLCGSVLVFVKNIFHFIFTFMQYGFLFKNSNVIIKKNLLISHLGIAHVIVTNIAVWFKFILEETFESVRETPSLTNQEERTNNASNERAFISYNLSFLIPSYNNNSISDMDANQFDTKSCVQTTNQVTSLVKSLNPFLHPCTIEYSIICGTLFYIIWRNVGKNKLEKSQLRRYSLAAAETQIFHVDCNQSMKGLFSGILVMLFCIIILIIFIVSGTGTNTLPSTTGEQSTSLKNLSYYLTEALEIILHLLIITVTLSAFFDMRKLHTNAIKQNFDLLLDEALEIFGMFGVFSFGVFRILDFRFTFNRNVISYLFLLNGILSLIQSVLQTIFILEGVKKCCVSAVDLKRKKGREQVTFLIMINLCLWLLYSVSRNKYANLLFKTSNVDYSAQYHSEYLEKSLISRYTMLEFNWEYLHGHNFTFDEIIEPVLDGLFQMNKTDEEETKLLHALSKRIGRLSNILSRENAQSVKWIIINTISYPLLLYYHFHSSCCLSHMWKACFSST